MPRTAGILAAYAHQNPLIRAANGPAGVQAMKISDFLTRRELKRLDLYDLLYRHVDTEYQIAIALPARHERVIGLALSRRSRDFGARETS